jgi:hypothetical protein
LPRCHAQSQRRAALSDAVFVALDRHPPAAEDMESEAHLFRSLVTLTPRLIPFFSSFITLDIFWLG